MSVGPDTSRENVTLSEADLAACKPMAGEGGHVLRALCPFHGSDHQRSLRVTVATGRFVCFACGAWGYMAQNQHSCHQPPTRLPYERAARTKRAAALSRASGIRARVVVS